MSTATATPGIVGELARHEIRGYLRSKLFWVGFALTAATAVGGLWGRTSATYSTAGDGLVPAMALGVLGMNVMAGRVRSSDRAAAAGAPTVPQRTRTLALAASAIVPGAAGLAWFVCAVLGYALHPPAAAGAPFGSFDELDVYAQMFAQGVVPAFGGPLLGLMLARWLPGRGVVAMISVVVVLVTVVLQPLFDWAHRPRLAWVWIHFFAPGGIEGDPERLLAYPGSPYPYIAYQVALCALAVLVAMYRDPEAPHARLRRAVLGLVAVSAVLSALAVLTGPSEVVPSPVPSPAAAAPGPSR